MFIMNIGTEENFVNIPIKMNEWEVQGVIPAPFFML